MSAIAEAPIHPNESASVKKKSQAPRATAESMAARQRDISVSEFFAKNRHLLGFDNPRKALLTTVKEAVDNSLDACEEGGILPDITVVIEDLQPGRGKEVKQSRYRITVVDNGPGIVRAQVENIFGRLLYGSKFHRLKMSRGQQGIGISAAGMYGLITTGKPMAIQTRPKAHKRAHHIELAMNTKTNRAEVTVDEETEDFPLQRLRGLTSGTRELDAKGEFLSAKEYPTGTSVSIELEGRYQKGRGSVDEFLELTAIANPHARIVFVPPSRESAAEEEDVPLLKGKKGAEQGSKGAGEQGSEAEGSPEGALGAPSTPAITTETNGVIVFPRAVGELPPETKEIMPHPRGIELGILLQMLKESEQDERGYTLYNFLQDKFSRVSASTAGEFCKKIGLTSRTKVSEVDHATAEKLYKQMQEAKLPPPPTDCLAPIGVRQMLAGMLKGVRAEFYAASSREAAVYRGRPFLIEAAIAFGGELPTEDQSRVIRFANRVPLLFQQSGCSSFKAVSETNWRNYDLQQPRGSVPVGPIVIMIHMASVWVPFTSESKEAIADYDEIRKEMKLALMECGRKLGTYLRKRMKMKREAERRDIFERYIGEISQAINAINGTETKKLYDALLTQAKKRTAIADLELDEEGKRVKEEDPADAEGVIIVESAVGGTGGLSASGEALDVRSKGAGERGSRGAKRGKGGADPFALSKQESARLKVSAMRDDEDEQPKLIEVAPAKRASVKEARAKAVHAKGAKEEAKGSKGPAVVKKPETKRSPEPNPPTVSPKPGAVVEAKKPKQKMRLDLKTGKMVPVDEGPKLF